MGKQMCECLISMHTITSNLYKKYLKADKNSNNKPTVYFLCPIVYDINI